MKIKSQKGLTLIEAVVYITILTVLSAILVNTALVLSSAYAKARVKRRIVFEASSGLERIIRETRLASAVDLPSSSFDVDPSRIQLSSIASASDPTPVTKEIYVNGGRLFLEEGGNPSVALTSDAVRIDSFIASFISTSNSEAVKYGLLISGGKGKASSSVEFFSTAVLRRSY